MEAFTEFAGAGLLGIALIVWWRLFAERTKDRDYYRERAEYWQEQALNRAEALDSTLDAAEGLMQPLKKVEKALPKPKEKKETSRTEQLEAVVEFLLQNRK